MNQRAIWDAIWSKPGHQEWDPLSEQIYLTLLRECGSPAGLKILEAGSGSGRISLRLACNGANVILVDYSEKAILLAQKAFKAKDCSAEFILADITELPLADQSVDISWNSGVLEHFSTSQQIEVLKEMKRVTKQGGKIISFNPNARCLPYRVGKYVAEITGSWPYGIENPVTTLSAICEKAGIRLEKEYSIALVESLDFLCFVPNSGYVRSAMETFLKSLSKEEMELFPGYLLVSVMLC
ncbi:MAG: class I SAM-dependent methyltransferase [Firmicutes bacterium]|nr:class I SAM-dependent methyltransferase [Bacillota bacterium]